jgi:Ca-activated chloride channel homolog
MASNPSGSEVTTHRVAPRRRPWVVPASIAVVGLGVASLVTVVGVIRSGEADPKGCTGQPMTVTIASSATHFSVLSGLARRWTDGAPSVDGRCVAATVTLKGSSEVAAALGPGWDPDRDGPRPDVWTPDSSLWVLVAASRQDTANILPQDSQSIASSPVVLAVRRPVAQALGWPKRDLGWEEVLGAFSQPDIWATLGHPELATLRLGMTDPTRSTAGLASILAILDRDANGELSDAELTAGVGFTQLLGAMAPDTTVFINELSFGSSQSAVAAFPVLEREIAVYNATDPTTALVPVYARQAPLVADFPYAILNADWVDSMKRAAARQFLDYVRGPVGLQALGAEGFRGADLTVRDASKLPAEQGFRASVAAPRPNPGAASVSQLITDWTALQRQSNILVVLDTSGSMNESVPGTALTRLQLLQQTAVAGFGLLNSQSNIGLWQFSVGLTPSTDYRELVSYGSVAGTIGGVPRKQALVAAVEALKANGGTGLYDSTYAAVQALQPKWEPNDTNIVLLITDGKNQDDDGLSLRELLDRLRREAQADRPIPVISIAVGPEADTNALRQISAVTGGRTFIARDPKAALQTLILAFAGRLR